MKERKMKILGVIPARGGSKGLPNKNILPLNGKPVIAYTIEAALACNDIDRTAVSSDSEEILQVARQYDVTIIPRPAEFAQDESPIEDALRHAIEYMEEKENFKADILVWLTANVPIRDPDAIGRTIRTLIETGADSACTVCKIRERPEWTKKIENNMLVPFLPTDKYRRQDLPPLYRIDGAVLAMFTSTLKKTRNRTGCHAFLGARIAPVEQEEIYSLEIDSPFDFQMAEVVLKLMENKGGL